jgi:putative Ca2+/H+ antiporter (TMEM165/GDT1 family)
VRANTTRDTTETDACSESGLFRAFFVIIVSEIGDKTFLVAAILAMRHPRMLIFLGAIGALAIMSILSAALGHILPQLLPHRWTTIAASGLFLVFGAKMLQEGLAMQAGNESIQEEMKEVEQEIQDSEVGAEKRMEDMEEGHARPELPEARKGSGMTPADLVDGLKNLLSLCLSPILIQCFIMTFLAEWGDRSQITTIALGAAHVRICLFLTDLCRGVLAQNVWVISLGTIVGHGCCTLGAVLGGRWLATKISVKHGKLPPHWCLTKLSIGQSRWVAPCSFWSLASFTLTRGYVPCLRFPHAEDQVQIYDVEEVAPLTVLDLKTVAGVIPNHGAN